MSTPYSIVILAQNEERNIADCLRSCMDCDDVHVVDGGSLDQTAAIAARCGAHVHHHAFESFAKQRNWATDAIPFKYEWILHLDADERLTPELDSALRQVASSEPQEDGFLVPSKLIFMGKWLRRADEFPKYQVRFFHRARMRFIDYGHGQREADGARLGLLDAAYLHLPFENGIEAWLGRHVKYSRDEAREALTSFGMPVPWRRLVSGTRVERRRALKALAYRAPGRAQIRWIFLALVRGGVLEGRAGLRYISLVALYERMVAANIAWERAQQRSKNG